MKIIVNLEATPADVSPGTDIEVFVDTLEAASTLLEWLEEHVDHTKTIYHNL